MAERNNKIHIFLLIILGVLFVGLMFLSTSNKNIEQKYTFLKEITLTKNNYNLKIGELYVKNTGILAAKIPVNNYKGCVFDSVDFQYDLDLSYIGSTTEYNDFTGYSPKQFVEVESKKEKTFSLVLNSFYPYAAKYDERGLPIADVNITKKEYDLYIFNVEPKNDYYYQYCINADKADATEVIKIIVEP